MRRFSTGIAIAVFSLLLVAIDSAQQMSTTAVPNLIRYGGTLKDAADAPITRTTGVTFAIYKRQDGDAPVWMETQNVTPDANGQYGVLLGSTTATGLPNDLFSQEEQRWLGVQVQGQSEQPRVLLVSVPYAFKAHEAETLAGKSISDFVLVRDLNSTQATPGAGSSQTGASGSDSPAAQKGVKVAAASAGPTNFSGSTTDQIVQVTQTGTGAGIIASTSSTTASSNAVVGTIPGPGVAILGQASSASAQGYGIEGKSASTIGIGLLGFATATTGYTYGLKGYSSSTSGTGVRGLSTAATGATYGVSGAVSSPNGTGMWGQATATNGGTGIWGQSQATTGAATGVLATAASNAGTGIVAAESAATGTTYGLNAAVQSPNGTAAWLQNTAGGSLILATTGPSSSPVTQFSVDGNGNVVSLGSTTANYFVLPSNPSHSGSTGDLWNNAGVPTFGASSTPVMLGSTNGAALLGSTATGQPQAAALKSNYIYLGNNGNLPVTIYPGSVYAANMTGSDMCAQIANAWIALSAISSSGGIVDARSFSSNQVCAGSMWVNYPPESSGNDTFSGTVLLGGGVTVQIPDTMIIPGGGAIYSYSTRPWSSNVGANLQASNSFPAGHPLVQYGITRSGQNPQGIWLENIGIDCRHPNGTFDAASVGVLNRYAQENSGWRNVQFTGCHTGFDIEPGGDDSGPYEKTHVTVPSESDGGAHCGDLGTTTAGLFKIGFHTLSCVGPSSGTQQNVGININGSNISIDDVHVEEFVTGIQVGGSHFVQGVSLTNVGGQGGATFTMTSVIDIASSGGPTGYTLSAIRAVSSNTTNIIKDHVNGTRTAPSSENAVGFYSCGAQALCYTNSPGLRGSFAVGDLLGIGSNGSDVDAHIAATTVTAQGNSFNGNSQLIESTSDGKYPPLDGSLITNLPTGGGGDTITSPNSTIVIGGTSTATTVDVAPAAYWVGDWSGNTTASLSTSANTITGRAFAVKTPSPPFSQIYGVINTQDSTGTDLYSFAISDSTGHAICHPATGVSLTGSSGAALTFPCSEGTVPGLQPGNVYILLTTGNATVGKVHGTAGSSYLSAYYSTNVTGCTSASGAIQFSTPCNISLSYPSVVGNMPVIMLH
jgi:hypothetical protein